MSEHSDRLAYDEEANAEPVAPGMIQASESVEDFRHFFLGDTAARIEYVDAHVLAGMTAAHEIRPPGSVYLTALLIRLRRTVPRSRASLMTDALVETVLISMPFRRAVSWFS